MMTSLQPALVMAQSSRIRFLILHEQIIGAVPTRMHDTSLDTVSILPISGPPRMRSVLHERYVAAEPAAQYKQWHRCI